MMEAQKNDSGTKSEEEVQNATGLYVDMVQKTCILHMKQRADTEDVFQIVFLKYIQSEPSRDREHEKAWLLKVTMNACRERFRGQFHKHVDLQTEMEACADLSRASYFLLDTLNQLPPHCRDILYPFYYGGYKMREIPKIKGKNENTICTRLKRGKEALRGKLRGELDNFQ